MAELNHVRALAQEFRPKEYERQVLEYWRRERIYERLREALKGRRKFYFLDGPPYTSADTPHIGTLWNKVLKDVIVRFRRMQGLAVVDTPGYDCHGLPIEVKIEQELGFKSKKDIEVYGIDKFVEKCREFSVRNALSMSRWFEEFGVSLRWEKPYMTLDPEYIQSAWWLVKRAEEQGLLERGLRVVHWCPRCETALADYEVTEYRELTDPSIYVKFPVKGRANEYLLVWTTTPWTLPANVAVMAHPDLEYVWVEVGSERLLLAASRLETVMREAELVEYRVIKRVRGRELLGLEYEHPLADLIDVQRNIVHKIVLSSKYVSAEEGTGLVHCAPGHGEEDFEVGLEYGLPVVMPVDDTGAFTSKAGKYSGKSVREANSDIISDLRARGLLFIEGRISHRYPVCWRCKTPLILRATQQWFIRVRHLKNRFIEEAEKVQWVPEWAGSARFKGWVEGLRDWVISRQRYWGTPAPIWLCERCGRRTVVGSVRELESLVRQELKLKDLHRPWIDEIVFGCPHCGGVMRRVADVMDVWLDSGVAFYASLSYPSDRETYERMRPVDVIVEGHDQIAGWFFSLMRCGLVTFGTGPYTTVVMHGFMLDERGREMHKSLGNYVAPEQVLDFEKGSRDVFRWYVLRNTPWEDMRFSWKAMAEVYDDMNILWNVYVFASMYMSIDRFNPREHPIEKYLDQARPEDRWLLSRIEKLTANVTRWLENYETHKAAKALRDFIVEDVSRWYIRLIRPRVWVEENIADKLSAYATLYYALRKFLVLAAPFIPFTSEQIYLESFRMRDDPDSVHMLPWPEVREEMIDEELERQMEIARKIVERAAAARMRAGVKIRVPLPRLYILTDDAEVVNSVARLRGVIESQVNVKEVKVLPAEKRSDFVLLEKKPVLKSIGSFFKSDSPLVLELLKNLDAREIKRELEISGAYLLKSQDGRVFELKREMIEFEERCVEGFVMESFEIGDVVIEARPGLEELREGLARDVVRRIQFMRKMAALPVEAVIEVEIYAPPDLRELLATKISYIKGETRASEVRFIEDRELVNGTLIRDWDLEGYNLRVGIIYTGRPSRTQNKE
ncbi:MAG: isoleucine--tRNA ligase [Thermofilaceae archaeon]